jgi:hypothetical protein
MTGIRLLAGEPGYITITAFFFLTLCQSILVMPAAQLQQLAKLHY